MTTTEKPAQENTLASPSPDEPGAETLTLSVGPQHSGSGHMRLIVELDGDIIITLNRTQATFIVESRR